MKDFVQKLVQNSRSLLIISLVLAAFSSVSTAQAELSNAPVGPAQVEMEPVTQKELERVLGERNRVVGAAPASFQARSDDAAPTEIAELARALRHDPDLISEYVHDQIEYEPLFGIKKGALGALIDKRGNPFDQSALMVALLRESGYTASYVYGEIELSSEQILNWVGGGTTQSLFSSSLRVLMNSGTPTTIVKDGTGDIIGAVITHVWVKVNIDGVDYVFDPSYTQHEYLGRPLDLAFSTQYDRDQFLNEALSGATQAADYIQNVNRGNVRRSLVTYTARLTNLIRNHPLVASFGLKDVFGGKEIIPNKKNLRLAALPYQQSITEEWTQEIPERYQTRLQIQHLGIDVTYSSADIYGKRLTIRYNASNQPELRLEGNLVGTGSGVTAGTAQPVTFSATHPYAVDSLDQSTDQQITANPGHTYLVVNGWGRMGKGMVDKHRRLLLTYKLAGHAANSEAVLGQNLMLIGSHWVTQTSMASELNDALSVYSEPSLTLHHHFAGIAGQATGPYVDLPLNQVSITSLLSGDLNGEQFFSLAGLGSAFEHSVIEQTQTVGATSTVQLLNFANARSHKIYELTKANFAAIRPLLTGYSAADLDGFKTKYLDNDFRILLPENGKLDQEPGESWTGYGALIIDSNEESLSYIIQGGLKGGFSRRPVRPRQYKPIPITKPPVNIFRNIVNNLVSADPIDLVTGHFLYDNDDLTIGSSELPVGLGFQRHYSSSARLTDGPLGYGWHHSFDITAEQDSNAYQSLGEDSPIDAVAAIVAVFVSLDILKGEKTKEKLIILSLIQKWMTDQMTDKVVNIIAPGDTQQFVKQPNGVYNPPPGSLTKLTQKSDGSYRTRSKDGVVMDFGLNGKLKTRKDAHGNTLTLTYNSDGQVATVSNNFNRTLTLTYKDKKITEVMDGTGRKVQYHYDAEDNLVNFTNADNQTTRYVYDLVGRMTQIFTPQYPEAPVVTNVYDQRDKVTQQTNGDGHIYDYYFAGHRSEEVDPLDHSKIWYYNEHGNNIRAIDELNRETRNIYDGQQRLKEKVFPGGNALRHDYDQFHRVTKTSHIPKTGSKKEPLIKTYAYENKFHKLKRSTDALGRITDFHYDAQGNLVKIEQPAIEGVRSTLLYGNNRNGQRIRETDAEGRITRYAYDNGTGDLTRVIRDPKNLNMVTKLGYDAVGNVTSETDPNQNTTRFSFDPERRRIQSISPEPFTIVSEYQYDKEGHLISQRNETGDSAQPWQTTAFVYNRGDNVIRQTDPQDHVTEFIYDGNNRLISTIDAENRLTDTKYDAAGQVIEVSKLLNEVAVTVAKYKYTRNGQQRSVTDGNGNTTRYIYGGFDRLITTTYPDGSQERLVYDPVGNVVKRRTRAKQWFNFDYDPLDRLITKTRPGNSQVDHHYDLSGVKTKVIEDGREWSYRYDTAARLIETVNSAGKIVQYGYDDNGNRTQLTYPDGFIVDYSFDQMGRMDSVKQGQTMLAKYTYDVISRRKTLRYANGTQTDYGYEIDNDVAVIDAVLKKGPRIRHEYQYNATSQISSRQVNHPLLNWIARGGRSDVTDIQYGSNAINQYVEIDQTLETPLIGIRELRAKPTYDQNGNLTSTGALFSGRNDTYRYDSENRLIKVLRGTKQLGQYRYDPFGRRIEKKRAQGIITYSYSGDQVLTEEDNAGNLLRRYVYGAGIDEPIMMVTWKLRNRAVNLAKPHTFYYHFDATGSVSFLSGAQGVATIDFYAYSPYGETHAPFSNADNPYRYSGRRHDEETGLYYYRARYYDPELGRFLQPDPIGYGDGLNLYSYVGNDPLNLIDPFGTTGRLKNTGFRVIGAANNFALDVIPGNRAFSNAVGNARNGNSGNAAVFAVQSVLEVAAAAAGGRALQSLNETRLAAQSIVAKSAPKPKLGSAGGPGQGKNFPQSVQDAARTESGNKCVFCGVGTIRSPKPHPQRSNIDHAIPKVRRGNNTQGNAQNTCQTCNLRKGAKTTEEFLNGGG